VQWGYCGASLACSSFSIVLLINQASFVLQLLSVAIQSLVYLLIRRWLWGHQAPWFGQLMPHFGGFKFQTIAPNGKGMNAGREGKVSIEGFLERCIGSSSSSQPRKNWTRMVPLSPKHRFTDGGESWKNRKTSFKYLIPGSLLVLPLRLRCSARAHSTLGSPLHCSVQFLLRRSRSSLKIYIRCRFKSNFSRKMNEGVRFFNSRFSSTRL
jgi:hypothetical protein